MLIYSVWSYLLKARNWYYCLDLSWRIGDGLDKLLSLVHFRFRISTIDCLKFLRIKTDALVIDGSSFISSQPINDYFNPFLAVAFSNHSLASSHRQPSTSCSPVAPFLLGDVPIPFPVPQCFGWRLFGVSFHFNDPTVKFLHIFAKICHLVILFVAFRFGQSFARSTPQSVGFNWTSS